MFFQILTGIIVPFIGTALGAGMVFFLGKTVSPYIDKLLLGLSSGVMLSASVWSLLIPSMETAADAGVPEWLPASLGFFLGMIFPLILEKAIPEKPRGENKSMLFFAVTLHNIPEGMAVGVAFAGALAGDISYAEAFTLALGIGIQNFPEGAVISLPMRKTETKTKSFMFGLVSGIVEPISAVVTLLATSFAAPLMPFILAFAAGAMIYAVTEELIPESSGEPKGISCIGTAAGFTVMMLLDILL